MINAANASAGTSKPGRPPACRSTTWDTTCRTWNAAMRGEPRHGRARAECAPDDARPPRRPIWIAPTSRTGSGRGTASTSVPRGAPRRARVRRERPRYPAPRTRRPTAAHRQARRADVGRGGRATADACSRTSGNRMITMRGAASRHAARAKDCFVPAWSCSPGRGSVPPPWARSRRPPGCGRAAAR